MERGRPRPRQVAANVADLEVRAPLGYPQSTCWMMPVS
jgi:hypothetical protein